MGRNLELMQKGAPRGVLSWAGPSSSGWGEGAAQWQKSPSPAHRITEGAPVGLEVMGSCWGQGVLVGGEEHPSLPAAQGRGYTQGRKDAPAFHNPSGLLGHASEPHTGCPFAWDLSLSLLSLLYSPKSSPNSTPSEDFQIPLGPHLLPQDRPVLESAGQGLALCLWLPPLLLLQSAQLSPGKAASCTLQRGEQHAGASLSVWALRLPGWVSFCPSHRAFTSGPKWPLQTVSGV